MVESARKITKSWSVTGKTFPKFMHEMNTLTFDIFTHILFGKDVDHITSKLKRYELKDGSTDYLNFKDFFMALVKDFVDGYYNPISSVFFYLNHFDLINPFKRNKRNLMVFYDTMNKAINESKDKESLFNQLLDSQEMTREEIFMDLIFFLLGGAETSSHTVVSCLYLLKKNPEALAKVEAELKILGFDKYSQNVNAFNRENIMKADYLTFVIKEALRLDGPAPETFYYMTSGDVTIADVPIPSNFLMKIDIYGSHYNPDQWKEPTKFLPERFDPNSIYSHVPFAYIPFSHGKRACPGQTLGMLQVR